MHYVQRRRRTTLRQRIVNGEVDLQALGIKRIQVPQEVLDKLPLYMYVAEKQDPPNTSFPSPSPIDPINQALPSVTTVDYTTTSLHPVSVKPASQVFDQPTCSICFDDFASQQTTVRELPCGHIYHPECIDPFLKDYSPLCALCKGRVLPIGYCPTVVSNAMVRRERLMRRLRESRHGGDGRVTASLSTIIQRLAPGSPWYIGRVGRSGTQRQAPGQEGASISQEMVGLPAATPAREATSEGEAGSMPQPAMRRAPGVDRAEWVRRRASALVGRQPMADDVEREREERSPWLIRLFRKVFPGL